MVEIGCEKSINLETSRNVTKSKRSLHWCRSISKKISVQVLLQYQSKSYYIIGQEVYYSIGRFYYIIGQLLHYRAVITLSGVFITLSGSYYSIGRLLHYRLVQRPLKMKLSWKTWPGHTCMYLAIWQWTIEINPPKPKPLTQGWTRDDGSTSLKLLRESSPVPHVGHGNTYITTHLVPVRHSDYSYKSNTDDGRWASSCAIIFFVL